MPEDVLDNRTLSQICADFVVGLKYSDLSPEAVSMAKDMIIDGIGCALAAAGGPIGSALQQWLAGYPGQSRTLGGLGSTDLRTAVLANGTLIQALEFDDIPHFASVEVPPALAIAESHEVSGEEFITAVVAGFEVAGRITAMLAHGRPHHPIGTVGAVGAAVVAAKLLKLDRDQTTDALGVAASSGAGITQNFGKFAKAMHAGRAAEAGYTAATLAQIGWSSDRASFDAHHGFLSAYCDPMATFEPLPSDGGEFWITRLPEDLTAGSPLDPTTFPPRHSGKAADLSRLGLGAPIDQLRGGPNLRRGPSFKPWPACGGNNAVLTAMFSLLTEEGFDRSRVESFEIIVPAEPARGATFRVDPQTALEGKYSLPYGVAAAWLDGEVVVSSYEDPTYLRIREAGLLDRIKTTVNPEFMATYENRPAVEDCNFAALIATMDDGTTRTAAAFNRGIELAPSAIHSKFLSLTEPSYGSDGAWALLTELSSMDRTPSLNPLIHQILTSMTTPLA